MDVQVVCERCGQGWGHFTLEADFLENGIVCGWPMTRDPLTTWRRRGSANYVADPDRDSPLQVIERSRGESVLVGRCSRPECRHAPVYDAVQLRQRLAASNGKMVL